MSLLGTLAKVAIGIAVAKGVGGLMNKGKPQQAPTGSSSGGLGDLLEQLGGGATSGGSQPGNSTSGGALTDILEQLGTGARSGRNRSGGSSGGLGDLLEQLGGGRQGSGGGGLGDLIGDLGGKSGSSNSDALGDVFGDFLNDGASGSNENGSFGDIFNQSLERGGEPEVRPTAQQEVAAALMLRAMIQAAKSDGTVDHDERKKLMDNLGGISAAERRFVEQEFAAPIDVPGLAQQVPLGLEQQVYLMSVMGIDLDNRAEAEYLHELATEMGINHDAVNTIHDKMGVPRLYS